MWKPVVLLASFAILAASYFWMGSEPVFHLESRATLGKKDFSDAEFADFMEAYDDCFTGVNRERLIRYYQAKGTDLSPEELAKRVDDYNEKHRKEHVDFVRGGKDYRVAYEDKRVVGFYFCGDEKELTQGGKSLYNVCVTPKARGKGYGRKLVEDAIKYCRKDGHPLMLTVTKEPVFVVDLYKKLGFKIVDDWVEAPDTFYFFDKHIMYYLEEEQPVKK
jgi:GNAT superfamily N-acetyltransferase